MKIVFKDPKIKDGTIGVSLDGGANYIYYKISEVLENGIPLKEDQDLSLIKIKGQTNILQNTNVISSIKVDDAKGIKFILDTDTYGTSFRDCVVGAIIQDGITSIGSTLSSYKNLTSIIIPNSITTIDNYAFSYCTSLKSITIPSSVTKIDFGAFEKCESLVSINIPDGITTIHRSTFYDCKSLVNINIPDSVTTIEYNAFYNCRSLTTINIPSNITNIGSNAFRNCYNLNNINYAGNQEQWSVITKSDDWNRDCPIDMTINYNYKA